MYVHDIFFARKPLKKKSYFPGTVQKAMNGYEWLWIAMNGYEGYESVQKAMNGYECSVQKAMNGYECSVQKAMNGYECVQKAMNEF